MWMTTANLLLCSSDFALVLFRESAVFLPAFTKSENFDLKSYPYSNGVFFVFKTSI
jgi:hypothetical protein